MTTRSDPTIASILRATFATYRAHFRRVASAAVVFLVPLAMVGALLGEVAREVVPEGDGPGHLAVLALSIAAFAAPMLGMVAYAGFLDAAVARHRAQRELPSLRAVVTALPWRVLVLLDLIVIVGGTVFTALFVVPGAVFATLVCLVGPLANVERLGVRDSIVRSASLVRPYFWLALVLVTVPVALEHWLLDGALELVWDKPFLVAFLMNATVGVAVLSVVGLVEVTLAEELRAEERAR